MTNQVFIPELLVAGIKEKLGNEIKLFNIVDVQDIEGQDGDTATFLSTEYIGDAEAVSAGTAIPNADFKDGVVKAPITKYAKGIKFTEEELKFGAGRVGERAENQIAKAVAAGLENALYAELAKIKAPMTVTAPHVDKDAVSMALVKFGDDLDSEKYLLVSPEDAEALRNDTSLSNVQSELVTSAGMIYNAHVVVSARVKQGEAYLINADALSLGLSQDVTVKEQADIETDTVILNGRVYGAVALTDEQGAVKIKVVPETKETK